MTRKIDKNTADAIAEAFDVTTHNGVVTVHNGKSGGHMTLRIKTAKKGGLEGKRILEVCEGDPQIWSDWKGIGFVNDNGVRLWRRARNERNRKLARILEEMDAGREYGLRYLIEGTCRRCNRALTNPDSIYEGIGPVCRGRENEEVLVDEN